MNACYAVWWLRLIEGIRQALLDATQWVTSALVAIPTSLDSVHPFAALGWPSGEVPNPKICDTNHFMTLSRKHAAVPSKMEAQKIRSTTFQKLM